MKLLFFILITGVYSSDSIEQVTNGEVIIMKTYDLQASSEICRGIAIHPIVVMTAAECVDGFLPSDLVVGHLRYLLISDVSKIIIHPEYTACSGTNNFAILIMKNVITTENVIACLPDEMFLNNADLIHDCSNKLITTRFFNKFSSDTSQCLSLPHLYRLEAIPSQICELDSSEIPNILKNRKVEMMICKPISKNPQCLGYYFAHDTSTKICSLYGEEVPFNKQPNYVYSVVPWIRNEMQKYVNGVPRVSSCILILTTCIITHFSI